MQQAKGCTAIGSPVGVRVAGCKGRPLLFPGLGQGGPPLHVRPKGRSEGAGFGPFFRPRVGQEGNSPAGHTRVEMTATTQPNPFLEMSRVRLGSGRLFFFAGLGEGTTSRAPALVASRIHFSEIGWPRSPPPLVWLL